MEHLTASVQRDTEFTDVILVVKVPSGVATTTGINWLQASHLILLTFFCS